MSGDGHVRHLERNRHLEALKLAEAFEEAAAVEDLPGPSARIFRAAGAMLRDYAEAIELVEELARELSGFGPDHRAVRVDADLLARAKAWVAAEPPPDEPTH